MSSSEIVPLAYFRGAMGILLVYSITDDVSFKNIHDWLKSIEKNAVAEVTKILIGNKCDLEENRVCKIELDIFVFSFCSLFL